MIKGFQEVFQYIESFLEPGLRDPLSKHLCKVTHGIDVPTLRVPVFTTADKGCFPRFSNPRDISRPHNPWSTRLKGDTTESEIERLAWNEIRMKKLSRRDTTDIYRPEFLCIQLETRYVKELMIDLPIASHLLWPCGT